MNKAKMIRETFDQLGWDTKTKDIKETLKQKGVDTTSQQVSNIRAECKVITIKINRRMEVRIYATRDNL